MLSMMRSNRDLAKFKYFLTYLQDSQEEQPRNIKISQWIVMLVSSEITPEEFFTHIQSMTQNSLEEFHFELIKIGLPLLRTELDSLISQSSNGHSTPPLNSFSSQEFGCTSNTLSDGDMESTTPDLPIKRIVSLTSTMSECDEFDYSITQRTSEVSLKRNISSSGLDQDNVVALSPCRLRKMVRLTGKILPLLQEFMELSNDSLSMGSAHRETSETDSNDSLQIAENGCSGIDTPNDLMLTLCANCNRTSVFSCVCQTVCYCSTFCRNKNREAHQSECYETSPSSSIPLTLPQAIYIDRPPQPSIITIQNGNPTPLSTGAISPNLPTPIYFQAIELPITSSSPATTPICSISQH